MAWLPIVDLFFRVEIRKTDNSVTSYNTYAHTQMGKLTDMTQNTIREVHTYGPKVIQVVINDYVGPGAGGANAGGGYMSGWTVTRLSGSGGSTTVSKVSRFTRPINAHYGLGWNVGNGHNNEIEVEHQIFLELQEAVGTRSVFRINGPTNSGISFLLPYSDKYMTTPIIRLNQLGYNPRALERYAYVSGW